MRGCVMMISVVLVAAGLSRAQDLLGGKVAGNGTAFVSAGSGSGDGLPPGIGWITLENTDLFSQYPSARNTDFPFPASYEGKFGAVYAYSSGAADIDNNRLLIWGGGHNDYCGNEIYALNLEAHPPAMNRLNEPSLPSACSKRQGGNPLSYSALNYVEALPTTPTATPGTFNSCTGITCRPNARHTVDLLNYVPGGRMWSFGNEVTSAAGIHSVVPWSVNLPAIYKAFSANGVTGGDAATVWNRWDGNIHLGPNTAAGPQAVSSGWGDTVYDPSMRLIWEEFTSLFQFDPESRTYTVRSSKASRDGQMQGAFDPDHHQWWLFGGAIPYSLIYDTGNSAPSGVGYWDLSACSSGNPAAPARGCAFRWVGNVYQSTNEDGVTKVNHYVPTGCDLRSMRWTAESEIAQDGTHPKGSGSMVNVPFLAGTQNPGVAWDPIWHTFVIWQNRTNLFNLPEMLFLFNPDPDKTLSIHSLGVGSIAPRTCVQIDTSRWIETSGPEPGQAGFNSLGVYGRFAYFPKLDVFAVCHGHVNCKILRLRDNSVGIRETSGRIQNDLPISVPRAFRQGEIAPYPQPYMIDHKIVSWQTDVKNRWPDGSVKFAVVSFVIPLLPANTTVHVSFKNTANNSSCDGGDHRPCGFLDDTSQEGGMLNSSFNFDAQIALSGRVSPLPIGARRMLEAGKYTYWLRGPVVTAVRIADEKTRAYDVNVDGAAGTPLHPIFEAWFYPQTHSVQIGYCLENAWISSSAAYGVRDQTYTFKLFAGQRSPALIFTQSSPFQQIAFSRWHKVYWLGKSPPVAINFNTPYLESTKLLPNYDVTRDVTVAANNYAKSWSSMSIGQKSLAGDPGAVCSVGAPGLIGLTGCIGDTELAINSGGAHQYVGPLPSWQVLYLLTMDEAMNSILFDETLTNADLLGYLPFHFREADVDAGSGRCFDQVAHSAPCRTVGSQGRFVSVNARQDISLYYPPSTAQGPDRPAYSGGVAEDGNSAGNWLSSTPLIVPSHAPEIAFVPYLFTGQNYYLEELMFQAASYPGVMPGTAGNSGSSYDHHQGRLGLFSGDSLRQTAWGLRTLARAATMAVDGSAEQDYLRQKLNNNLAFLEGTQGLADDFSSNAESTTAYNYGAEWIYGIGPHSPNYSTAVSSQSLPTFINSDPFIPPLYGYTNQGDLTAACGGAEANFQEYYLATVFGILRDMGYSTSTLLDRIVERPIHIALDPMINNIYLIGNNAGDVPSDPTLGLGYAYCTRKCTTWSASGSIVPLKEVTESYKSCNAGVSASCGSCSRQGNFINYRSAWNTFSGYFGGPLNATWTSPGQMEENFAGEASAALSFANSLFVDGFNGRTAYNALRDSGDMTIFTKFSTMTPKWDIIPRQ